MKIRKYMPRPAKTKEQFIKEIKDIYGENTFDLSKVVYINNKTKVSIGCKIHGFFEIYPNHLLKEQGCRKCGLEKRKAEQCEELTRIFVEKSRKIHGNKYIYDKVRYRKTKNKVTITCRNHGDFLQTPRHHLRGSGCQECGLFSINKKKFTSIIQEEKTIELKKQLRELFGDKYNLDKTVYNGSNKLTTLTCPIEGHGNFDRYLAYLLKGNGCQKCLDIYYKEQQRIKEYNKFLEKAKKVHHGKYNYDKVEYITHIKRVIITCPKHGDFLQKPHTHLNGSGCSKCINKSEAKIYNWLEKMFPDYTITHQYKPDWLKPYSFDFYIEEIDLIIELDGLQHFEQVRNWKSPEYHQEKDAKKMILAKQHGLTVFRIPRFIVFKRAAMIDEKMEEVKKYIVKQEKPINLYFNKALYKNLRKTKRLLRDL